MADQKGVKREPDAVAASPLKSGRGAYSIFRSERDEVNHFF